MATEPLTVQIQACDRELIKELFGSPFPEQHSKVIVDGIEVSLGEIRHRRGMSTEDIIITIVINLTTGIATSLIAAWIYSRLAKNGQNAVEIGSDPIVKTAEAEILEAVTEQRKSKDLS